MPRVNVVFDGVSRGAVAAARATRASIHGVGDAAKKETRTLNLFERTIRYGMVRALYATGTAATIAGGGIAFLGFKFNDLKQRSTIAFTTMLGSGQRAQRFLNELRDFAAKTPFEFPDLIRASQRLLGMGIDAKQVIPTMTALGNAVAAIGGNAEQIDIAVRAIGQIQAKGRLMAEEMMQLNEAGVFSWRDLAREIGRSVPEAMKLVERGAVSSDAFLAAFQQNSDRRFRGMMDRQSHTFSGLLSTLKDRFTELAGVAMKPLFDLTVRGMEGIVNGNGKLDASAKRVARTFGVELANAVEKVVSFFREHWEEILNFLQSTYSVLQKVLGAAGKVAEALDDVVGATVGWKRVMEALIALKIARTVYIWAASFTALAGAEAAAGAAGGTGAAGAAASSGRLLTVLRTLAKIGLITIGIEVLINYREVGGAIGGIVDRVAGAISPDRTDPLNLGPRTGVVQDAIRDMARQGLSARQIQARLRNKYKVTLSLAQIQQAMGGASSRTGTQLAQPGSIVAGGGGLIGGPGGGTHSRSERGYIWQDDDAVDITVKAGAAIFAIFNGVVASNLRYGGDSGRFSGWGFTLLCDNGAQYYYKHLRSVTIKAGQRVKRGQVLGFGTTTGHLHLARKGATTTAQILQGAPLTDKPYTPGAGGTSLPPATSLIGGGTGGDTDGAGGKATKPTIIGLRGQIDAHLRNLPAGLSDAGKAAARHLRELRKQLRVGMSSEDVARTRVGIQRWAKVLTEEIRKAKDAAAKAAREAAEAAARALERQFGTTQRHIERDFDRATQTYVDAFNKTTQARITDMRKGFDRQIRDSRKAFQAEMALFDRETEAALRGFEVDETPAEAALRQFQAARRAEDDAKAMAAAAGDPERLRELELQRQEQALEEAARASREAQNAATQAQQEAYRNQRAAQREAFEERQSDLEAALQERFDAEVSAYEEMRAAELQQWTDLRDDQREALLNDLEDWHLWITEKKKSWMDFLNWLRERGFTVPSGWLQDDRSNGFSDIFEANKTKLGERMAGSRRSGVPMQHGGRVPGQYVGREDTVFVRATPGEEVLDRGLSRHLRAFLAGGGGRVSGSSIGPVYVLGTTEREVARALASLLGPELPRRISYPAER